MQCARNNLWKIIFVCFVLGVALLGYKTSNKNNNPSIKVEITEPSTNTLGQSGMTSKQDIEQTIKEFILQNPEVIIKSIELMHERKVKEMEEKIQNTIKEKRSEMEQSNTPHAGNDKSNNSVIMFYDYNCDYCKKANEVITQLLGYDDNVKIVYMPMPMPMLGESSEYMSKLMLAVHKVSPEKFQPIHNEVIALRHPSKEDIDAIITKHGLKMIDVETEASTPEIRDTQSKINTFASELRIHGAPAFVIGNKFYPGFLDLSQMQKAIADDRIKNQSDSAPAPTAEASTDKTSNGSEEKTEK